jgi:hypothetical protein
LLLGAAVLFVGTITLAGKAFGVWQELPSPKKGKPAPAAETVPSAKRPEVAPDGQRARERRHRRELRQAKARWVREANRACAQGNREVRALVREYQAPTTYEQLSDLAHEGLAVERRLLERLRALPDRRVAETRVARMISLIARHERLFTRLVGAFEGGDYLAAVQFAENAGPLLAEASDIASELGAAKCGEGGSNYPLGSLGVAPST